MTKRIELPGDKGDWVEVNTAWDVTRGQRRALYRELTDAEPGEDGDAIAFKYLIRTWSFPESVSTDAINNLPVPVANALATAVRDFMAELSPDFDLEAIDNPKADTASSESSGS